MTIAEVLPLGYDHTQATQCIVRYDSLVSGCGRIEGLKPVAACRAFNHFQLQFVYMNSNQTQTYGAVCLFFFFFNYWKLIIWCVTFRRVLVR